MSSKEKNDALQEVKILSTLQHPYIISYRDKFIEGGFLCIVMDFASGGDLQSEISKAKRSRRNFPESKIMKWFTETTLALKYLHEKHILHRDQDLLYV